jgi:regulator of protease activity HflC (stomatin/prohibitin superfamily)
MAETSLVAIVIMVIVIMIIMFALMASAFAIIKPNEQGLYSRMGRFIGVLSPGMNFITPLVGEVKRVDMSMQSLTLSFDDLLSDKSTRLALKMNVHYRITDPKKAVIETPNYIDVVKQAAETSIRLLMRSLDEDQVWANSNRIKETLRAETEKTTSKYGIAISIVELLP